MQQWVISAVIAFILRQIAKFATTTDWVKVKGDLALRLQQLVPLWLAPGLQDVANMLVDAVAKLLANTKDLQAVADKLVAGDIPGAFQLLLELAKNIFGPPSTHSPGEAKLVAALHMASAEVNAPKGKQVV